MGGVVETGCWELYCPWRIYLQRMRCAGGVVVLHISAVRVRGMELCMLLHTLFVILDV